MGKIKHKTQEEATEQCLNVSKFLALHVFCLFLKKYQITHQDTHQNEL